MSEHEQSWADAFGTFAQCLVFIALICCVTYCTMQDRKMEHEKELQNKEHK